MPGGRMPMPVADGRCGIALHGNQVAPARPLPVEDDGEGYLIVSGHERRVGAGADARGVGGPVAELPRRRAPPVTRVPAGHGVVPSPAEVGCGLGETEARWAARFWSTVGPACSAG